MPCNAAESIGHSDAKSRPLWNSCCRAGSCSWCSQRAGVGTVDDLRSRRRGCRFPHSFVNGSSFVNDQGATGPRAGHVCQRPQPRSICGVAAQGKASSGGRQRLREASIGDVRCITVDHHPTSGNHHHGSNGHHGQSCDHNHDGPTDHRSDDPNTWKRQRSWQWPRTRQREEVAPFVCAYGPLRCGKCGGVLFSAKRAALHTYVCVSGPDHRGCGQFSIASEPVEAEVLRSYVERFAQGALPMSLTDPFDVAFLRSRIDHVVIEAGRAARTFDPLRVKPTFRGQDCDEQRRE